MGGGGEEEEEVPNAEPPSPSGDSELRQVVARLDSLISFSRSIKAFAGKWQSIRSLLQNLSSGLTAAEAAVVFSRTGENSAFSELLATVASTVDEAHGLAGSCAGETFPGGKLLMRSNLDLLASRFDLHRRTLDGIFASGALTHATAIVLSKPAAGAPRDEMRFYVKDLYSRMKLADPEMAARALTALNEILTEDDKYARIAAVEMPEVVGLLVDLLESDEEEIQQEAAEAVAVIAGFHCYRPLLVLAGVVAALIKVLEMGSSLGKERAAKALKKLTENSDNAWSVSAHGGVMALLKICADPGISAGELLSSACGVLRNLAAVGEIKRFMVEQGAVTVFLNLSGSKDEVSQIQGMEFLQVIAGNDPAAKARVMSEGGMESLVQFLGSPSSSSPKAMETALRAIEAICFSSGGSVSALIRAGFLDRLLVLLGHGETSVQESALKAAARLCEVSEEARRNMGERGFMTELLRLLEAKSMEVREMAAEALARMMAVQRNQKRFVQEEDGVGTVLLLLEPDEKTATRNFLLSALVAISGSSSGRRKIAQSVHVKRLEKLAEMEIADAKRIVKRLSSGRLWNLLTGILSS